MGDREVGGRRGRGRRKGDWGGEKGVWEEYGESIGG